MRKTFPGYYCPEEDEFKSMWANGIFVVDACVLIDLYLDSGSDKSHELLRILDKVSDRLWLPHQAALEYQRVRLEKVSEQQDDYGKLRHCVNNAIKALPVQTSQELVPLLDRVRQVLDEAQQELEKTVPERANLLQHSQAGERIAALFAGRVGRPYSTERLAEIYMEAANRYLRKIPPGYKDEKKEDDKRYGDVVLWYQVIDKGKESCKPIILVTKEQKEDWFQKTQDGQGRIVGPRPELANEMAEKAQVPFYLYRVTQFLERASAYVAVDVDAKAIEQSRRDDAVQAEQTRKMLAWLRDAYFGSVDLLSEAVDLTRASNAYLGSVDLLSETVNLTGASKAYLGSVDLLSETVDLTGANKAYRDMIAGFAADQRTLALYREALGLGPYLEKWIVLQAEQTAALARAMDTWGYVLRRPPGVTAYLEGIRKSPNALADQDLNDDDSGGDELDDSGDTELSDASDAELDDSGDAELDDPGDTETPGDG